MNFQNQNVIHWFKIGVFFLALSFLYQYVNHPWNPSLLDDVGALQSEYIRFPGDWKKASDWFELTYKEDLEVWGRFRPLWIVHQGILYSIYDSHPLLARLIRLGEWALALFFWFWAFRREKNVSWWILLLALACPYFYDSLFFISVQEMQIIFFSGLYVLVARSQIRGFRKNLIRTLAVVGGCLSKEPTILFFLGYVLAELFFVSNAQENRKKIYLWCESLALVYLLYKMASLGKTGGYTSGAFILNFGRIIPMVRFSITHLPKGNPLGMLLTGAIVLSLFLVPSSKKGGGILLRDLSPLILGAIFFTGILVLWEKGVYYLGPLALMWSAPIALAYVNQTAPHMGQRFPRGRLVFELGILVMMVFLSQRSINKQFQKNSEVGIITGFLHTAFSSEGSRTVYYPKANLIRGQVGSFRILLRNRNVKVSQGTVDDNISFLVTHVTDAPMTDELARYVVEPNIFRTTYWQVSSVRPDIAPLCKIFSDH